MSKRLICLLLSLVMVLAVCLTGCSKKTDEQVEDEIEKEASAKATTLSVWLMTADDEHPVSNETAAMITEAVNRITEKKFKTRLVLHFATPSEYYGKLDAAFAQRATTSGFTSEPVVSEDGEEETVVNEWGLIEIAYPTVSDCQVDLFYLGGLANYNKYMEQGLLTNIQSELSNSTAEEITKYVPAAFLDAMKTYNQSQTGKSGTYAIPNSTAIGEYTYMLLSKEALRAAYRETGDYSDYTSLACADVQDFLQFVSKAENGLSDRYYPLYSDMTESEILAANLQYWGVDAQGELSDAFSVLGGYYDPSAKYLDLNAYARITNLLENEKYKSEMRALLQYKLNSYFGTPETQNGKKFAVGYVQDTLVNAMDQYGDEYVILPMATPRLTEAELFSDLFAVSTYTSSKGRSMEILKYLNTNEEFRNLILYGIEGEHYDLVEADEKNRLGENYQLVERRNNDYLLKAEQTGNVSIAYPLISDVVTVRDNMITQNLDANVSLSLGFKPNFDGFVIDATSIQAVRVLSEQIWQQYLACTSLAEFDIFIENAKATVAASADVQKHIDYDHGIDAETKAEAECDGSCGTLGCVYDKWLIEMEIKKK